MTEKLHPRVIAIQHDQDLYWRTQYAARETADLECELVKYIELDNQIRARILLRYSGYSVNLPPDFSRQYTLAIASLKRELSYRSHYKRMTM